MTPLDPLSVALQPWQNFYMLTGAAAATLTGLMFVAVTFGSSLVTRETSSAARAFLDPPFMHFVQVLFTGCLAIIPTLTPTVFGALLVALGGFRLLSLYGIVARYSAAQRTHGDVELSDWIVGIVLPLLGHALLITAGVGFVVRRDAALTGLAVVNVSMLLIGIYGAWELLVWMAMTVIDRRDGTAPERRGPRDD
jgi:hypothetical protein